jgi:hypothetical protein
MSLDRLQQQEESLDAIQGEPTFKLYRDEHGNRQVVLIVMSDEDLELAGIDPKDVSDAKFMDIADDVRADLEGGDAFSSALFWACDQNGLETKGAN